jgi:tetratricopeptide (TPR) repeat protein
MRWRVYLICVWALIFASPVPRAHAQEASNQTTYLNIFLKYNEAFNLEKQGDFRGALAGFQDCLKRLNKLHTSDPNWETALVIQRMADCKAQIADLGAKVAAMPPETPATPSNSATPSDQTPNTASGAIPPDTASLQAQLDAVKRELADTKEKLKNSLIATQTYRDQLAAVNQQLDALKTQQSVDDRVGKLLSDNKALTDKLAEAQKQLDQIKSPQAMTLLRAKLKNSEDQLAAAQAANVALQQTTNTLKTQLDQAQADLSAATQKLAAIPTNSPEYATIKHENEIMRGILTREIQEQSRRDGSKRLAQEEFDRLKITSKVLQEQLDILGSPMSPPANDEERMILASLKGPGMDITSPGNVVVAPNTPLPTQPDMATTNAAPSVPAPADNSTNSPPVTVVADNTTPPPSPPVNPDTNSNSTMPAVTPPPTGTIPATSADNSAGTSPATDTNAPTVTRLPAATTTVTETTIQNNNAAAAKTDPTQFSTKPRLPDDMRDTAQQAADLFKMQRYDDAANKYQAIIDKYPESLYAWSNLGVVRFQQGKLTEALKALQQSVKLSPSDAFSYMNLGIVYYQLNQYENAIDALEHAIALDPNNAKAHNYLGCACSQKGWQEVAEQQFRKAIDIEETFGDAHFNLALVYATSKPPSFELARRHYNRAVELGIGKDARLEKLLQQ